MSTKTKVKLIFVGIVVVIGIILFTIYREQFLIALFAILIVGAMLWGLVNSRRRSGGRTRGSYREEDYYDEEGGGGDLYVHRRTVRCGNCGGTSRVPSLYIPRATIKCPACQGTGRLWD